MIMYTKCGHSRIDMRFERGWGMTWGVVEWGWGEGIQMHVQSVAGG